MALQCLKPPTKKFFREKAFSKEASNPGLSSKMGSSTNRHKDISFLLKLFRHEQILVEYEEDLIICPFSILGSRERLGTNSIKLNGSVITAMILPVLTVNFSRTFLTGLGPFWLARPSLKWWLVHWGLSNGYYNHCFSHHQSNR